jgi:hypothetical protein
MVLTRSPVVDLGFVPAKASKLAKKDAFNPVKLRIMSYDNPLLVSCFLYRSIYNASLFYLECTMLNRLLKDTPSAPSTLRCDEKKHMAAPAKPTITTEQLLKMSLPDQDVINSINTSTTLLSELSQITETYTRDNQRELLYIQIDENNIDKICKTNTDKAREIIERTLKQNYVSFIYDSYNPLRSFTSLNDLRHHIIGTMTAAGCPGVIHPAILVSPPLPVTSNNFEARLHPPRYIYGYQLPGTNKFFVSSKPRGFLSRTMQSSAQNTGISTNQHTLFALEPGEIITVRDSLENKTTVTSRVVA